MRKTAKFDLDQIDAYSLEPKKTEKKTSNLSEREEEDLNEMILRYIPR